MITICQTQNLVDEINNTLWWMDSGGNISLVSKGIFVWEYYEITDNPEEIVSEHEKDILFNIPVYARKYKAVLKP